uniref:Uncharacterized protein n=1 Tax=Helianthus annuus TaxID=4232 RepID=A0A251RVV8_HELAN
MVAMTQRSTVWWPDLPFEVEGTGQILTQFHGKIYLNFQLVCSRLRNGIENGEGLMMGCLI